jgi:hypothetical protein
MTSAMPGRPCLIACEVFRDEFEAVCPAEVARVYLPQGLHRTPAKMPDAIQEAIDRASESAAVVLLGYGLCSNGVVSVAARSAPIILPRVHDCIALLLGSRERYEAEVAACAGTYYITAGWARYGTTSLSCYKNEYLPKYGEEDARYILHELLKHYTRVGFVDLGVGDVAAGRAHAREMADLCGLAYVEVRGSLAYLRRLVHGPWDETDFVRIAPGEAVSATPFFDLQHISLP